MSKIPAELRYAKSHEWVQVLGDGTARVGITDFAQAALGDITFVQLPKVGARLKQGEAFGVVESVKAASDIYAPLGCEVVEVNSALAAAPETLNGDPYAKGWLIRVKLDAGADAGALLDAVAYEKVAV